MSFNLERALKHRAILLHGDEDILLRRALSEILGAVAPEGDDFDLVSMEADTSTPIDWMGSAGTAPFLAARRTCIVRHLLRSDEFELLDASKLPEYALLILVADEEVADDNKQKKQATLRGKWAKQVNAGGGLVVEFESDPKALPAVLRKEAEGFGVKVSPAAASLLSEMVGGSLSRGLGELEKLAIYAGPGEMVTETIVREVTTPSREWNVFQLVDMAARGDVAGALRQLQILVVSPSKADDAIHGNILPQIHRQLRLLWQARIVVEAKASADRLPETIRAQFPERPNFAKEPPYRQSRLMGLARQMTFASLTQGLQIISDADAKLKGMLPSFSSIETIEEALLMLAKELRAPAQVA